MCMHICMHVNETQRHAHCAAAESHAQEEGDSWLPRQIHSSSIIIDVTSLGNLGQVGAPVPRSADIHVTARAYLVGVPAILMREAIGPVNVPQPQHAIAGACAHKRAGRRERDALDRVMRRCLVDQRARLHAASAPGARSTAAGRQNSERKSGRRFFPNSKR
jgi:hypothetical protein